MNSLILLNNTNSTIMPILVPVRITDNREDVEFNQMGYVNKLRYPFVLVQRKIVGKGSKKKTNGQSVTKGRYVELTPGPTR